MGRSPYLILPLNGKQNQALATWYSVMKEEHPRYAAVYARAAISYYINNKAYLSIGSVTPSDGIEDNQKISIYKDEILSDWINKLSEVHMSAGPIATAILRKSIEIRTDGSYYIPDIIDILNSKDMDMAVFAPNNIPSGLDSAIDNKTGPQDIPSATESPIKDEKNPGDIQVTPASINAETTGPPNHEEEPKEEKSSSINTPPNDVGDATSSKVNKKTGSKRLMANFGSKFE